MYGPITDTITLIDGKGAASGRLCHFHGWIRNSKVSAVRDTGPPRTVPAMNFVKDNALLKDRAVELRPRKRGCVL